MTVQRLEQLVDLPQKVPVLEREGQQKKRKGYVLAAKFLQDVSHRPDHVGKPARTGLLTLGPLTGSFSGLVVAGKMEIPAFHPFDDYSVRDDPVIVLFRHGASAAEDE